jgi:hypothetical protein
MKYIFLLKGEKEERKKIEEEGYCGFIINYSIFFL